MVVQRQRGYQHLIEMSDTSNKRYKLSDLTTYISNVSNLQERVVLHIIRIKVNCNF